MIKSFDKVYVQGSTSVPEVLIDAMVARADELRGVEVYSAFAVATRDIPYGTPEMKESFIPQSFFVANNYRNTIASGYGSITPCFLGEVPALVR